MQFFDDGACGEYGDEYDDENRCDVTKIFHGILNSITLQMSEKIHLSNLPMFGDFWAETSSLMVDLLRNNTNKGEEKVLFRLLNQSFMYFCNRKKVALKVVYTPF